MLLQFQNIKLEVGSFSLVELNGSGDSSKLHLKKDLASFGAPYYVPFYPPLPSGGQIILAICFF